MSDNRIKEEKPPIADLRDVKTEVDDVSAVVSFIVEQWVIS